MRAVGGAHRLEPVRHAAEAALGDAFRLVRLVRHGQRVPSLVVDLARHVEVVHEAVLGELLRRHVVLRSERVREHGHRLARRLGVPRRLHAVHREVEDLAAVVARVEELHEPAVHGHRRRAERRIARHVVRRDARRRRADGLVEADGEREPVRRRLTVHLHDGRRVRRLEILGVGIERLDRAEPCVGHHAVARHVRVEEVGVEVRMIVAHGGVHVEERDLLPLRLLGGDDARQGGVVRLDARVVGRSAAPEERGEDHVRVRLRGEDAVQEPDRAAHVVQRVGAGVVRAEVEKDDMGRFDLGEPVRQVLVDAAPALRRVKTPAAVAFMVCVHPAHRAGRGGRRPNIVHVVSRLLEERPERPSVTGGALRLRPLGDRVAQRHDAQARRRPRGKGKARKGHCQQLTCSHCLPPGKHSILTRVTACRYLFHAVDYTKKRDVRGHGPANTGYYEQNQCKTTFMTWIGPSNPEGRSGSVGLYGLMFVCVRRSASGKPAS